MSDAWPTELLVSKDRRQLTVSFDDGSAYRLDAEMLRVLSPSAEVQGHGPGQKITVPGKRNVAIRSMVATGNYAVRIVFDDGHDSGSIPGDTSRNLARPVTHCLPIMNGSSLKRA